MREAAPAKPIDWGALGRATQSACKTANDLLRSNAHRMNNPVVAQVARFCALVAGVNAFHVHMAQERAAKEATERKGAEERAAAAGPRRSPSERPTDSAPVDPKLREAAILLGVPLDASVEKIRRACRAKLTRERIHPDHGGNAETAKRVIAARDLLVRRAKERS
jgi:hypothetical protein